MSHTIVIEEAYRSFERENAFNAVVRHCKIGKVTRKVISFPRWQVQPVEWWRQSYPAYDPLEDIMIGGNRKSAGFR